MEDKDSELLKEAIADAQTIKEVALQNAKDVLEEAFTTRLQSMISDRIQREAEEEMGYDDLSGGESEEEDEDVSGSAEVEKDQEGDLEGLELDLDFGEEGGGEMEEPTDSEVEDDMEDLGGGSEDSEEETDEEEPQEAPTGDTEREEESEEDIDLEEVLEFLEGEEHQEEEDRHEGEHKDMDEGGDYETQHETDYEMEKESSHRDSDIQEIINDLEEDVEAEDDLDEQIEEFLQGLDETVYDVDLNELQEEVSRSSQGSDDILEIDVDKLEEEFQEPQYRQGTEGHDTGGLYDGDDTLDGYEPVSGSDLGNHGPDDPAVDAEETVGMSGASSPDLGDLMDDEGYYDGSSFDGYEPVSDGDVSDHGPDEPAPGLDQDLGEDDISYGDLLSELGSPSDSSSASRSQDVERLREENEELREKLGKHRQAVKILRNRINEVNLINSKLLYTNRLFKRYNLNENQKLRVIEALDRAKDKRGAKLVYSTLSEAFDSNVSRKGSTSSSSSKGAPSSSGEKQNLAEAISRGMSSKKQGTQEPEDSETKQKILNEDVEMKSRMQKLADIS